jgi:acylphosphatase
MLQVIRMDWPASSPTAWVRRWPGRWGGLLDGRIQASVLGRLRARLFAILGMDPSAMAEPAEPRIRFVISGRVQGVGFRAWALRRGQELGVRGWVRNCRDGSVEVEAAGPLPVLLRLRQLVADGPPLAHVAEIREEPPRHDRLPNGFEIR